MAVRVLLSQVAQKRVAVGVEVEAGLIVAIIAVNNTDKDGRVSIGRAGSAGAPHRLPPGQFRRTVVNAATLEDLAVTLDWPA